MATVLDGAAPEGAGPGLRPLVLRGVGGALLRSWGQGGLTGRSRCPSRVVPPAAFSGLGSASGTSFCRVRAVTAPSTQGVSGPGEAGVSHGVAGRGCPAHPSVSVHRAPPSSGGCRSGRWPCAWRLAGPAVLEVSAGAEVSGGEGWAGVLGEPQAASQAPSPSAGRRRTCAPRSWSTCGECVAPVGRGRRPALHRLGDDGVCPGLHPSPPQPSLPSAAVTPSSPCSQGPPAPPRPSASASRLPSSRSPTDHLDGCGPSCFRLLLSLRRWISQSSQYRYCSSFSRPHPERRCEQLCPEPSSGPGVGASDTHAHLLRVWSCLPCPLSLAPTGAQGRTLHTRAAAYSSLFPQVDPLAHPCPQLPTGLRGQEHLCPPGFQEFEVRPLPPPGSGGPQLCTTPPPVWG